MAEPLGYCAGPGRARVLMSLFYAVDIQHDIARYIGTINQGEGIVGERIIPRRLLPLPISAAVWLRVEKAYREKPE